MGLPDKSRGSAGGGWLPQQMTRLLAVFAVLAVAFLIIRPILVPATFGQFGHYRAAAVDEIAARPITYAGRNTCVDCHQDEATSQGKSPHQGLTCESCHGPLLAHLDNPSEAKPMMPRERDYCPICHGYDAARPNGFPQVVVAEHNEGLPCIGCHNPHQADLPSVPESCGACHGRTTRVMAASLHQTLACTQCHENSDAHKSTPRLTRPTKPQASQFCGTCHGVGTTAAPKETKRVDLATHYNTYSCWQCHFPHDPEVR